MSTSTVTSLATGLVTDLGTAGLAILGAVVVIIGALMIWRFGVAKAKSALKH